jgi:hypothetical protein
MHDNHNNLSLSPHQTALEQNQQACVCCNENNSLICGRRGCTQKFHLRQLFDFKINKTRLVAFRRKFQRLILATCEEISKFSEV